MVVARWSEIKSAAQLFRMRAGPEAAAGSWRALRGHLKIAGEQYKC